MPRLRLRAGIRFEHCTAGVSERGSVLPQACDDPADVGYLVAAQPHHVGRTGHLLFPSSAIFLRECRILRDDCAAGHDRKAQDNASCSHAGPLLHVHQARRFRARRIALKTVNRLRPRKVLVTQLNVRKPACAAGNTSQCSGNPAATQARSIRSTAARKTGLAFFGGRAMLPALEPGRNASPFSMANLASAGWPKF